MRVLACYFCFLTGLATADEIEYPRLMSQLLKAGDIVYYRRDNDTGEVSIRVYSKEQVELSREWQTDVTELQEKSPLFKRQLEEYLENLLINNPSMRIGDYQIRVVRSLSSPSTIAHVNENYVAIRLQSGEIRVFATSKITEISLNCTGLSIDLIREKPRS